MIFLTQMSISANIKINGTILSLIPWTNNLLVIMRL
jgi:hypothetical protein